MRPVTAQLDQSGALDGQTIVWDDAAGYWRPGSSSVSIDDLTDVDTSTPPTDGQVLVYDSASGTWIPVDLSVVGTANDLTTRFQPLVQVLGGVPELVYDSSDNLQMVEVPNP